MWRVFDPVNTKLYTPEDDVESLGLSWEDAQFRIKNGGESQGTTQIHLEKWLVKWNMFMCVDMEMKLWGIEQRWGNPCELDGDMKKLWDRVGMGQVIFTVSLSSLYADVW